MTKLKIWFALLIFSISFPCSILPCYAQSPSENLKKYWNYRDKFQKYFTKIGRFQGNSITFANIDNNASHKDYGWPNTISVDGPGSPLNGFKKTGDAMNMQGDYIAVLATQYKLLKDAGEDVSSTMNELYYAINAVNRVDEQAEPFFNVSFPTNKNGFTIRDDVGPSLAEDWTNQASLTEDPKDKYEGIASDYYEDSNPSYHSTGNEMSQDQSIGLMQGLLFVTKYVDNIFVKPTSGDAGFYIVDESKAIIERFMNYVTPNKSWPSLTYQLFEIPTLGIPSPPSVSGGYIGGGGIPYNSVCSVIENWTMVNPVYNTKVTSGSEMRPWAYPIARTADIITGNVHNYVGTQAIHFNSDDNLFDGHVCLIPTTDILVPLTDMRNDFWSPIQYASWSQSDVSGWHFKIKVLGTYNPFNDTWRYLKFGGVQEPKYNANLSMLLATMSASWSQSNVARIGDEWHMEIFDLMYAALNGTTPVHPPNFWENMLNSAPCQGPYYFKDDAGNVSSSFLSGWFDTNRWNGKELSDITTYGEYNGNDYMLLYNLYQIVYKSTPAGTAFPDYKENSCPCDQVGSASKIKNHTTTGVLNSNITISRRFPEYLDYNIFLKEFLIDDLTIPNNKIMDIQTDLVVCNNKTLEICSGGRVNVGTATFPNSSIIVRSGSTLHLSDNGKLVINDNCKVVIEKGAQLIYDANAKIELLGNNAVLEIQGDLHLGANAIFTFTYPGTTNSGYIKFSHPGGLPSPYNQISGNNSSIELKGATKTDKILEVDQNLMQVSVWNGITSFKIERGEVDYGNQFSTPAIATDANTRIWNSTFSGPGNVYVWGQPNCVIAHSDFIGGGVIGNQFLYGNKLVMNNCYASGIRTEGKGFNFYNVKCPNLITNLATINSFSNDSKFNDGSGVYISSSPVRFIFDNCKANNNDFAGYTVQGPSLLKIKCGAVKDNTDYGFHIRQGGSLSMNAMDGGGYVDAQNNGLSTINLIEANYVDIDNGYNELRPLNFSPSLSNGIPCTSHAICGYTIIDGTVVNNFLRDRPANNNKWQQNNGLPLQSTGVFGGENKFTDVTDIVSGNEINFVASSQANKAPCDYWDPTCLTCPRSFLDVCPACNVINTVDFLNKKTNDAVKDALAKMDTIIPNGHKQAVNLFYQILKYPLPVPTEGDKYVIEIAEKQMLISLAEAIEKGQVSISETTLAPEVLKVIDIENDKISKAVIANNQLGQFYSTIEKALIYYSAEHRIEAINTLNDALNIASINDRNYVLKMICRIDNEQRLIHKQIDILQFINNTEACSSIEKERNTKSGILPLEIEDKSEAISNFKLYPNPAQDKLILEYVLEENADAQFVIYNITGQVVYKTLLKSNSQKMELNGLGLPNGIYFYRITSNDKILQQDKLTIAK